MGLKCSKMDCIDCSCSNEKDNPDNSIYVDNQVCPFGSSKSHQKKKTLKRPKKLTGK